MRDDELVESLRSLGRTSVPPAPEDGRREATIEAMVEAARAPVARPRRAPHLWFVAAAAAALFVGSAWAWHARHTAPAVASAPSSAPVIGYVHGQSGEVVVVGARGIAAAPPASDRAWPLAAEDRIATLTDAHATVLVGDVASVQLSPGTEVVVSPASGAAMDVRTGSAQFDVSKLRSGDSFVVGAADVRIVVHGTSFRVTVDPAREEGSRTQVAVLDGTVSVLPAGSPAITLRAGDRWPPSLSPSLSPSPSPPPSSSSSSSSSSSPPSSSPPSPSPSASARSDLSAQNALLEQAATARSRGDTASEARALDAFITRFPRSPGLHDAVAGRMRAAARSGDRAGAAREAQRYLSLFPSGPLRDEASTLVQRARTVDRP